LLGFVEIELDLHPPRTGPRAEMSVSWGWLAAAGLARPSPHTAAVSPPWQDKAQLGPRILQTLKVDLPEGLERCLGLVLAALLGEDRASPFSTPTAPRRWPRLWRPPEPLLQTHLQRGGTAPEGSYHSAHSALVAQ